DFEGPTRVTGVTPSAGSVVGFPSAIIDSVDEDDGVIDGSGLMGHSWFSGDGAAGVTWTFDNVTLGGFPTPAGIVWTEGGAGGTVSFQAIAADGVTVLCDSGPVSDPGVFPDNSNNGETAEDRFFGVYDAGGISSIKLSNSSGGIEMDHIQFGLVGLATTTSTTTTTTTVLPTTSTSTSTTSTVASTSTSPLSTSTTSPTTSSSTTSSTKVPATTTTTLGNECPRAPTFDSILCLLDALVADVDGAGDLGRLKTGIRNAVAKALTQTAKARDAGTGKVAKTQLKKAAHSLTVFEHKLASNNAKKVIPQSTRDRLRAASAVIRGEIQTLRGTI